MRTVDLLVKKKSQTMEEKIQESRKNMVELLIQHGAVHDTINGEKVLNVTNSEILPELMEESKRRAATR